MSEKKNNRGTSKKFSFHKEISAGPFTESDEIGSVAVGRTGDHLLLHEATAYRIAMMAIGIGAHNFSEGLAIGQSYVSGTIGLAVILIIGFGAHNATEGFGIAGPPTDLATEQLFLNSCRSNWWWSHLYWIGLLSMLLDP